MLELAGLETGGVNADFLNAPPPPGRSLPDLDVGRPRALHQPRAFVARLQLAGDGGGREPGGAAARAGALPVDLGLEPRRVLLGARRRPARAGARGRAPAVGGRPVADRAAAPDRRRRAGADDPAAGGARRARGGDAGGGHRDPAARRAQGRRPAADGDALLRAGVPDPVAARHRPGASVPVHRQRRLRHGAAAQARGRRHGARGAAAGAGAGAALRAAAGRAEGADPLPAARGAARGVPRQAVPRLRHARPLRLPGAARQRPRGRGGGRGPGARVRDGAEAPAARRGDPADDDRRRAARPAQDHRRGARRQPPTRWSSCTGWSARPTSRS